MTSATYRRASVRNDRQPGADPLMMPNDGGLRRDAAAVTDERVDYSHFPFQKVSTTVEKSRSDSTGNKCQTLAAEKRRRRCGL